MSLVLPGATSHRAKPRPILGPMQTRYLLVASLLTGLAILIAAAIWMATRL
jgi:hypothetical protein